MQLKGKVPPYEVEGSEKINHKNMDGNYKKGFRKACNNIICSLPILIDLIANIKVKKLGKKKGKVK